MKGQEKMREILFRARIGGKWFYGDLIEYPSGHFQIWTKIREDGGHNYMIEEPETIGQFTGLLDRIGKRIFEGDILKLNFNDDEKKINVEYGIFSCGCCNRVYGYSVPDSDMTTIDIIGNVHDNPEMMEVKE